MFVNLSNHPAVDWPAAQRDAALELSGGGPIVDLAFPNVDPSASPEDVIQCACDIARSVCSTGARFAMVQGEPTLVYALVTALQPAGVRCFAATTARIATLATDGDTVHKTSTFRFVTFREYSPAHV